MFDCTLSVRKSMKTTLMMMKQQILRLTTMPTWPSTITITAITWMPADAIESFGRLCLKQKKCSLKQLNLDFHFKVSMYCQIMLDFQCCTHGLQLQKKNLRNYMQMNELKRINTFIILSVTSFPRKSFKHHSKSIILMILNCSEKVILNLR